jgi:hypothetical protein
MSQPRSSGMTRSFLVRTSWIGTFEPSANFAGAVICFPSLDGALSAEFSTELSPDAYF